MNITRIYITLLAIICFARHELIYAAPVDEQQARVIANNWYEHIYVEKNKPIKNRHRLQIKSLVKKSSNRLTSLYVYNFADGGFVLVSGNDACPPVLGYSTASEITENTQCPSLLALLESYSEEINWLHTHNVDNTSSIKTWVRIRNKSFNKRLRKNIDIVKPLIPDINWGQGYPYNSQCPYCYGGPENHCLVGCVAVAVGIIMKYWNSPLHYDWKNMPDQLGSYSNDIEIQAVARFLSDIGKGVIMDYGSNSSSSNSKKVEDYLDSDIGYISSSCIKRIEYGDYAWECKIKKELNEGRPVFYAGFKEYGSGHAFVCEGYDSDNRFYINWGWYGKYNGYFSLDKLSPGSSEYNRNQQAVINIKPSNFKVFPPENLNVKEVAPFQVALSWNDESSVYYKIYKNCVNNSETAVPLGDWEQTNSFTDTDICFDKIYYYWVRKSYNPSGSPYSVFSNVASVNIVGCDMNHNRKIDIIDAINILQQNVGLINNKEIIYCSNLTSAISVLKIVSDF